jgi:hypothetical protein
MGTRDPGQNRANPGGGDTKVEPSIKYRNCIFFFFSEEGAGEESGVERGGRWKRKPAAKTPNENGGSGRGVYSSLSSLSKISSRHCSATHCTDVSRGGHE